MQLSFSLEHEPRDSKVPHEPGPDCRVYHWNLTLLDQARTSTPGVTPLKKELPFLAGQLHERRQVKELRRSLHNHSIM